MEEEQIKIFADSLWDYMLEKKLKQYLSDSVCYYMATVVEPASDGFITVQRPFDNPVTLPCGANAERLVAGELCAVLVFGDFSNQIVIGNIAELDGNIITEETETALNGVLAGNGETVEVVPVDSTPTANSSNLVTSGGVAAAIANQTPKLLGTFATLDALSTLLDTELGAMGVNRATLIYARATANIYPFVNTYTYRGWLINSDTQYAHAILSPTGPSARNVYCKRSAAYGWVYEPITTDADVANPNILDNWYFAGGGSQLGDGTFPINQRGATSYVGVTIGIDRWRITNGYGTVSVASDSITLTSSTANAYIRQYLPVQVDGLTERMTFSALIRGSGAGYIGLNARDGTLQASTTYSNPGSSWQLVTLTFAATTAKPVGLATIRANTGTSIDILAVKLELGNAQTLAHWENGVWVLNELPNYEEQLIRCKSSTAYPSDTYANDPVVFESELNTFVRPNLLDNWYFIGGGSQQGGQQFPINAIGKTSYTLTAATTPIIDRWRGTNGTLTIASDHVNYTAATNLASYKRFMQLTGLSLSSGTVATVSMLAKINSIGGTAYMRIADNYAGFTGGGLVLTSATSNYELFTCTVTIPSDITASFDLLVETTAASTIDIDIKAVKIELGDTQTLAHKVNGVWMLNEIPNYEEQLIRGNSNKLNTNASNSYAYDPVAFQSSLCRENMLDNWYFVGGGSQNGAGIFPINERGATSYTGLDCIDRWHTLVDSYSTKAIQSDGLKLTHLTTGRAWLIAQDVKTPTAAGKTFTASVLVKEVVGTKSRLHIAFNGTSGQISAPNSVYVTAPGLYKVTAVAPEGTIRIRVGFYPGSAPAVNDYVLVTAMKLELGDTQTLAHMENEEWVLNELPTYEEQLIRCKTETVDADDTYANDKVMFQSMLHFNRPTWTMTGGKVFRITFPAYYRGIIYTFGSGVAAKSEIIVSSTSGATVGYASALAGSGITVAASGSTLTLTNTTSSTYIYVFIDTFSGVQPTWEEVTS